MKDVASRKQWRIGTRGSELALRQTEAVITVLKRIYPGIMVQTCIVKTRGDEKPEGTPVSADETGLFTKAIEQELLAARIDLAVHSLKDLPTDLAKGLMLGAILKREDPADVLISKHLGGWQGLPQGAKVMTGSLRRKAQLKHVRPDIGIVNVRGNVPTRLRKLQEGDADAIILALAGLKRLDLSPEGSIRLDPLVFLPACGQGAIAVEIRSDDEEARKLVGAMDHSATRQAVTAEREFLHHLQGGCTAPTGAYARMEEERLVMDAMLADNNGRKVIRGHGEIRLVECGGSETHPTEAALALGRKVAEDILRRGGERILQDISKGGLGHD
ncbi:MAG: hydroxymethylbilane synthase [Sedimentisphaerales bacterium]|nr:hydroxymethylbilane synthase [Sedimentisphaerales bacterium]